MAATAKSKENKKLRYRAHLVGLRDGLLRELGQGTAEMIQDEPLYSDSVDLASAVTDREFAMELNSRIGQRLSEVENAIRRVDSGDFGECETCGEEIPDVRMLAYPSTTYCLQCKSELEAERGGRRIGIVR